MNSESLFYWIGYAICDACGHTHPAVVVFARREDPFPKLECSKCGQPTARPLGSTGLERYSFSEWVEQLPRILQDNPVLWTSLVQFRPISVSMN